VEVSILGRTFRIACAPEEETQVRQAADYLDARMHEIRDAGKVKARERIAVLAALNLAFNLAERGMAPATAAAPMAADDPALDLLVARIDEVLGPDGRLL